MEMLLIKSLLLFFIIFSVKKRFSSTINFEMQIEQTYQTEISQINDQPMFQWYLMSATNLPIKLCTCQITCTQLSSVALPKRTRIPYSQANRHVTSAQKNKKSNKRDIILLFTLCHSQTFYLETVYIVM